MEFRSLSQCKSDLSFGPTQTWGKHLPIYSYKSQRLCGFDRDEACGAVELTGPLEDILFDIYPKLSFIELSRLLMGLRRTDLSFDEARLFQLWGFHRNEHLLNAVERVKVLPLEFQAYAAIKNLSPRDLEPLNLNQDMNSELIEISKSGASRSEAGQLIELIADLKMLGKWPGILDWTRKASELIEDLRGRRFPRRTALQKEARRKAKKLSWPKGAKWKWNTQSDQNILDLQLSLKSVKDLESVSNQLSHVTEQVSDEESNPWH